jgi:hypothetical protein
VTTTHGAVEGRSAAHSAEEIVKLIRLAWLALALCFLAACANTSDAPLPMVHQDDPTWGLLPDHLDFGALPQ